MSNLAVWSRPAWNADRWLHEFFGPAAAADWNKPVNSGFNPAAEVVKDGDDAVVRVELPEAALTGVSEKSARNAPKGPDNRDKRNHQTPPSLARLPRCRDRQRCC